VWHSKLNWRHEAMRVAHSPRKTASRGVVRGGEAADRSFAERSGEWRMARGRSTARVGVLWVQLWPTVQVSLRHTVFFIHLTAAAWSNVWLGS